MSPASAETLNAAALRPLPRWALAAIGRGDAGFSAGATLHALDLAIRMQPVCLEVFRLRQALAAATACARLLRPGADDAALRDAHHLTRPNDDPGQDGRLYRAWTALVARPVRADAATIERIARDLDLSPAARGADWFAELSRDQARFHPFAQAARVAARARQGDARHEILALMLADVALAAQLGWPGVVPLLAIGVAHPSLRSGPEGRRPKQGAADWEGSAVAAYAIAAEAAYRSLVDLEPRALRLTAAAMRLRTRGKTAALARLLKEESVGAADLAGTTPGLGSDRAARRFLDRLVDLGALRLKTDRPVFRLYGL